MSNQEAIALLRNLEDSLDSYCELNEEGKTAFRMAIESLELFGNSEQLPSADVQPVVHGEWVGAQAYCDHLNEEAKVNGRPERYLPSGMMIGVYCNQCWCRADKKSDFCPNCGCKMGKRKKVDCTDCIKEWWKLGL